MTLAIRPERVLLTDGDAGQFRGVIEQIVYEGINTTYHLRLPTAPACASASRTVTASPPLRKRRRIGIALPATP